METIVPPECFDGIVIGLATARACQMDYHSPISGWGADILYECNILGDSWTATQDRRDGVDGVRLEARRQFYAGGTKVDKWFWPLSSFRSITIASGGPVKIED